MKTLKLKNLATSLAVIATISFSSVIKADEVQLPVISRPSSLEEGTQTLLSPTQIADLLPWAKDSKIFLVDLLENTQSLSTTDQIDRLTDGLKQVVTESAPKNAELLMRYSLNRALVLNQILNRELDSDAVGSPDVKLRVLRASIKMAIKYYEIDMNTLTKKTAAPFVVFGIDYFEFLSELNKSVIDASAQYAIQRTALEWFQWDLYRDVNNLSFAPQIVKINNSLKTFPVKTLTDAQSISYLRQMKAVVAQIKSSGSLRDTIISLNNEKQNAERVIEEREIQRQQAEASRAAKEAIELAKKNRVYMRLSKGDLVSSGGAVRTVAYVTDKDEVVLATAYPYSQEAKKRADVEKLLTSYQNYDQGNIILYGNSVRTLEYIGENGGLVLKAEYPNVRDFLDTEHAAFATQGLVSYKQYKINNKVLYNGTIREIQCLDKNGRIVLKPSYPYSQDFTTADDISKVK